MYRYIPVSCCILVSAILLSCTRYVPAPGTPTYPGSTAPSTSPAPSTAGAMETSILANVNAHRRSMGLPVQQMADAISVQAYNHSRNMATGKTGFGHDGFDQRITNIRQSLGTVNAAAENVAYGSLSAKEVVNGWIKSPSHRKNMEGNYNLTGIGVYNRSGTLYFTQLFIKK